jgi:hypothetical protein
MNSRTLPTRFALTLAFAALMLAVPTASVAGPGPKPGPTLNSPPSVSGSPVQNSTLTASTGSWSGGVTGYAYEWQRCSSGACSTIPGATGSSYTLVAADVGSTVRVVVTASNRRGSTSAASAEVGPVAPPPAPPGNAPAAVSPPVISGTPQDGQTLSASTGTWNYSPTAFAYQWSFCSSGGSCSPFSSGNGLATYTLSAVDVGYTVRVTVTASNTYGSNSSTSAQTAAVSPKPAPAPSPVVTIATPAAGATISGSVAFTATVSNTVPQSMVMTVDGGAAWTEYYEPWVYNGDGNTLDTTKLTNGSHVLAVKAVFADGSSLTKSVTANVQNVVPSTSPVVAISSPAAGATVSGGVPFTATVSNAIPSSMVMTVDGGAAWTEYVEPWVYNGDGNTLDTTTLVNGSHVLAVKAMFADGSSVSTSVTANVQNSTPPPPTSTSSASHGAIGVMRYGDSYKYASGYDRYDTLLVAYGDVDAAASTSARSLIYKGGVDVFDSPNTDPGANNGGVPYKQALANGWLLTDSSGVPLQAAGYGNWLGDVGSPGFQKAWSDNVSTWLIAHHADGVFIDNVLCRITDLANGKTPSKYPTDTDWSNAYVSFIQYVSTALRAKGLYVSANVYCYGPPDGSANVAWWKRVVPSLDGAMTETFEQSPLDNSVLYFECPSCSWTGNWKNMLGVLTTAQSLGKDAFALSYGAATDTRAMTYTRATYLLVWSGKGGSFLWEPRSLTDPWNSAWTTNIGTPSGAMTQVGSSFVRDYTGGYVVVNPSQSSQTVALPAGLVTLSGAAAGSSVTLASTTAVIFKK